jgi:anti-anti-sigma regulatory factor
MSDAVTVDMLDLGDHACVTFSDPDERSDIIAAFVAEGLDREHKVLCFTDSISPERLLQELALRDVAVDEAQRRGQLSIVSGEYGWLAGGVTSAAKMIELLAEEVQLASTQGYAGLRVTADMCWATRPVAAVQELITFEKKAADLFAAGRLTAICQYDREGFDPVTLAFAADTHPKTVAAVAYHDDALLRICRQHRPSGIRIAGELDYNGLEPLQQALAEALRLDSDIYVNLGKLRFIDVTAATAIAKAGLSLPGDRHMVVGCGEAVAEVFRLIGAGEAVQLRIQRAT